MGAATPRRRNSGNKPETPTHSARAGAHESSREGVTREWNPLLAIKIKLVYIVCGTYSDYS